MPNEVVETICVTFCCDGCAGALAQAAKHKAAATPINIARDIIPLILKTSTQLSGPNLNGA